MYLPEYVQQCMDALENHGFSCYAVGGCVRDDLLGLTPHDYDLCTNALPQQMKDVFAGYNLILAGEKHGTVGVIIGKQVVEITTFRTDGDYTDNRHPDQVKFVQNVEGDLSRRDFTVNAMAWSPKHGLADPFGVQQDLSRKILRTVGDPMERFKEDALRILRGMRFSSTYQLKVEEATLQAMYDSAPLLENIAKERIFEELCKLMVSVNCEQLLRFAPILAQVIPELAPTIGFQQHNHHHSYDVFTHTAYVVEAAPKELSLRWAALLHDIGKAPTFFIGDDGEGHFYGHDKVSAQMADEILARLKAPNTLREDVVFYISKHMHRLEADRKLLRRRLSQWGAERLQKLLYFQAADVGSKGVADTAAFLDPIDAMLQQILQENACLTLKDLAINGHDLMELGFSGYAIGKCLNDLLLKVVDEELPNEKTALIAAARRRTL